MSEPTPLPARPIETQPVIYNPIPTQRVGILQIAMAVFAANLLCTFISFFVGTCLWVALIALNTPRIR